ncbi:MAG: VCBS repeat-containing protein [Planctomycetia bacterium]|nr:VCBS repeat-containing protein [Planctomycetia bacterium]
MAGNVIANATELKLLLSPTNTIRVADCIEITTQVDMFAVELVAGDRLTVDIDAQSIGSGLNSHVRLFDLDGNELAANDDFDGRDSRLTFQVVQGGTYYIGVSAAGNAAYDPTSTEPALGGTTVGHFELTVSRINATPAPDLVGTRFDVVQSSLAGLDTITIHYTVQNRGGATTGNGFRVNFGISTDNLFLPGVNDPDNPPTDPIVFFDYLLTFADLPTLAAGESFEGTIELQLPNFPTDPFAGPADPDADPIPAFLPGDLYCGMFIDQDEQVAGESNIANNHNQRRGLDWDIFHWLGKAVEVEPNDNLPASMGAGPEAPPADMVVGLNSRTTGSIGAPGDVDYFAVAVPDGLSGRLQVTVRAAGFDSRVSLFDSTGNLLVQSDAAAIDNADDLIVHHIAGDRVLNQNATGRYYYLKVEGLQGGTGSYELTVEFDLARPPFGSLVVDPSNPFSLESPTQWLSGDLNNDGILDLVGADISGMAGGMIYVLLGLGDGSFRDVLPAQDGMPELNFRSLHFNSGAIVQGLALTDFNGDNHLDLAIVGETQATVFLGDGTGRFVSFGQQSTGIVTPLDGHLFVSGVVTGDFNHDGILDLVLSANDFTVGGQVQPRIVLLAGAGDGTFTTTTIETGARATARAILSGDFDGDGITDLAVLSSDPPAGMLPDAEAPRDPTLNVLLLHADGTLKREVVVALPTAQLVGLVRGDFNGDGILDLAAASQETDEVLVFRGNGDGSFRAALRFAVDDGPASLQVADVNNDGRLDLVTANSAVRDFFSGMAGPQGNVPSTVSVLLGNGDGTFQAARTFTQLFVAGERALRDGLLLADLNGDGLVDVVGTGGRGAVYLGRGDGTFQNLPRFNTGSAPGAAVLGDFNNDGRLDIATANGFSADISILLAQGDGTFQTEIRVPLSHRPNSIAVGDFNRDGRLDLATAGGDGGGVSVVYGLGDGTFGQERNFAAGTNPGSLITFDFNGDGLLDLIVADVGSVVSSSDPMTPQEQLFLGHTITVLLGRADGTFQSGSTFNVDDFVLAVAQGDIDGDGRTDLIVLSEASPGTPDHRASVTVFFRNSNGTIRAQTTFQLDTSFAGFDVSQPTIGLRFPVLGPPAVADLNDDGFVDILTMRENGTSLVAFLGAGDGTFTVREISGIGSNAPGAHIGGLLLTDLDGDGDLDIAFGANPGDTGNSNSFPSIRVFLGEGQGADWVVQGFGGEFVVGQDPLTLLTGDFNQDGRPDLVTTNAGGSDVTLLLGLDFQDQGPAVGGLRFLPADALANAVHSVPIVADLDGDGIDDVVILDRSGNIQFRRGLVAQGASFAPPVVINAGFAARDVALLETADGPRLVAVDAVGDTVAVYEYDKDSKSFARSQVLGTGGTLPTRIVVGNLRGDADGRAEDVAVLNTLSRTVSIFLATDGVLGPPATVNLGNFTQIPPDVPPGMEIVPQPLESGFSDLVLSRRADGTLDLLVTNGFAGDLSVLVNDGAGGFTAGGRFRAGLGLGGLGTLLSFDPNNPVGMPGFRTLARELSGVVASGDFNGDGIGDVVVSNPGTRSLELVFGRGPGSWTNPVRLASDLAVRVLTVGLLNADGHLDIAAVDEGGALIVFLGDGNGGFTEKIGQNAFGLDARLTVGATTSGLTVRDVNGDAAPDLLVGNEQGDLLVLFGQGDGTFVSPRPPGQNIPLAVTDLDGDGKDDFIYASQSLDRVSVQFGGSAPMVFQNAANGILAPGAVRLADVNGDGIADLIVANSGANNVRIYLGNAAGTFGATPGEVFTYDVGTNPVSITVAQVNPGTGAGLDNFVDLVVANRGSNDITILLGNGDGTFRNGPRLVNAGVDPATGAQVGFAPTSTVVEDVDGDGTPDILVSFSGSNNVGFIQGAGAGAFRDNQTSFTGVGAAPGLIVPLGPGRFASLNFGANSITILSSFAGNQFQRQTVATRGFGPSSALAGDFNGDGRTDLLVGSSGDGLIELFLDDGGELLASGFLDTDLNISAMALSVIEGSRVFYVTSDGIERAFAFSLDQFIGEERGTVADLGDNNAVGIIAALVAGSGELDGADFFGGSDGETVNFGELLFFSGDGAFEGGTGAGGYTPAEALARLRELVQLFIEETVVAFTAEGASWELLLQATQELLHYAAAVPEQAAEVFGCWRTVVAHLRLPDIGEEAVGRLLAAGSSWMQSGQLAGAEPEAAALVDAAFRDGFLEGSEFADVLFQETLAGCPAELPQACGATWQEWLPASLLACGLPGWLVREAMQRDEQPRRRGTVSC